MTGTSKHTEHKATEPPHQAVPESHGGPGARLAPHSRQVPGRGPKTLAYRKDPNYNELLEHFQNAEWDECLHTLDRLLAAYPDDKHLVSFKQDVQTRSELQQHSERQREEDDRKDRRGVRLHAIIAALSGIVVVAVVMWFMSAYRAEATRQRLAAEATQTAEALAAKDEMADTFMKAGRAEEALALYTEIRKVNPAYEGVVQAIEAAQQAITVEDLYQQGRGALENGDNVKALEFFGKAEQLQPEYKDTSQLIAKITRDLQVASLVEAIDEAYGRGDSAAVIRNYEAIQAIDPFIELPDLDDKLFESYRDLVLQIAARPDLTLEEIQTAARYYRNALALFPQNLAYAREQAELQEVAIELLASQYYLQGISLLDSSDYTIEGLEQSILVLQRAREKAPASPTVDAAIEKTQLFIDSYDDLVHGNWDDAIVGLDAVYKRDADFAEGRVRYFLYEAYTSRGDLLMLNADFGGAFADYQAAEKFAWADEKNKMRLFQIEVRVAAALSKLRRHDQAVEFYHFAFEQVAYQDRLTKPEQASLLETLTKAEAAYKAGNELAAIGFYEESVERADELYQIIQITAVRGDTLPNIAFENGSTLASLRSANELGDSLIISRSKPLLVPVLLPLQP